MQNPSTRAMCVLTVGRPMHVRYVCCLCCAQSNNNLHGVIPWSLGSLSNLTSLDISMNDISGPIPMSISGLHRLRTLSLHLNQLNGTLGALSNMTSLQHL